MTSLLAPVYNGWNFLFYEFSDPRTRGWLMVGSPIPILLTIFVYRKFVKEIGPNMMRDRPPFNVNRIVQVYNVFQVIICVWLSWKGFAITYGPNGYYDWHCQPLDTSLSPRSHEVALYAWIYYMIKILDLLDTVFFILRKKFNQVSFLHFYHHTGILVLGYMGATYYPDGQGFLIVPLNSFVHCFMYFYYFLSNYNPEYKKNIWWKKYITQLQITQFLILLIQFSKTFIVPNCKYPKFPMILMIPQVIVMIYLFSDFYYHAYIKPKKPAAKTS